MEKPKHEEEHVKPTLNTGNRLKISIEEFSSEREDDGSTLGTEELEQQQLVYKPQESFTKRWYETIQ